MLLKLYINSYCSCIKEKKFFSEKKIRIVTALDLIKCLKQIKEYRLHLTCAPITGLPSKISTMGKSLSRFSDEKSSKNERSKNYYTSSKHINIIKYK